MGLKTALYDAHIAAEAKMVDFGGWDMPINYGSQIKEHDHVRHDAGMFDVSHMTVVDVAGEEATGYLQKLLANDVARLHGNKGKALYTAMLNPDGGIIDDLIVYFLSEHNYRLVVNCATREKDLAWLNTHAENYTVMITEQPHLAMIAVQGPNALEKTAQSVDTVYAEVIQLLKVFYGEACENDWFIARTGYTGEDGLEIMLPETQVTALWNALIANGVKPCGLGARDTLRLEAGMNLYGLDMDEAVSPLECGMAWTVCLKDAQRQFVGREALEKLKATSHDKQVGLILQARGVMRSHQSLFDEAIGDESIGEISSGTFSPTMQKSIAIARVSAHVGDVVQVEIRGKKLKATVTDLPFVRKGKILVEG